MLDWIITYPFVKAGKNEKACVFGADAKVYEYRVIKVYSIEQLIGVYVLRTTDDTLAVVYLYYAEESKEMLFASIVDQIIDLRPKSFVTENRDLLAYVRDRLYFPKIQEEKVSLSLPDNQQVLTNFTLQFGDGDSFA